MTIPTIDRHAPDPADVRDPPPDGVLLAYGPMLPLVIAGIAVWVLPRLWPLVAIRLSIVWAALLLAFIGGVRRGFGFARPGASKVAEIAAASACLVIALLALVSPDPLLSLGVLAAGFLLMALLDRRAALRGDAPRWFARLRPPQLLFGAAGLAGSIVWLAT